MIPDYYLLIACGDQLLALPATDSVFGVLIYYVPGRSDAGDGGFSALVREPSRFAETRDNRVEHGSYAGGLMRSGCGPGLQPAARWGMDFEVGGKTVWAELGRCVTMG